MNSVIDQLQQWANALLPMAQSKAVELYRSLFQFLVWLARQPNGPTIEITGVVFIILLLVGGLTWVEHVDEARQHHGGRASGSKYGEWPS